MTANTIISCASRVAGEIHCFDPAVLKTAEQALPPIFTVDYHFFLVRSRLYGAGLLCQLDFIPLNQMI
jgi:hypothetical protein